MNNENIYQFLLTINPNFEPGFFYEMMSDLIWISRTSPCEKSKRGCIILNVRRQQYVKANNSPPVGFCCSKNEKCKINCNKVAIHAEERALLLASKADWNYYSDNLQCFHLKTVNDQPVVSGNPSCVYCSKSLLEYGIDDIWLFQENGWKSWTAKEFHSETLRNLNLPEKQK